MQLRFCRPQFSWPMVKQIVACGSPNFLNNVPPAYLHHHEHGAAAPGGQNAVSIYGILMYVTA